MTNTEHGNTVQKTLLDYLTVGSNNVSDNVPVNDAMVFTVGVTKDCIKVFDNIKYEIIDRRRGVIVLRVYMPRRLRHIMWQRYKECMWGRKNESAV